MERSDLDAVFIDELGALRVEPAILDGLLVQEGARIGRGERDLDACAG